MKLVLERLHLNTTIHYASAEVIRLTEQHLDFFRINQYGGFRIKIDLLAKRGN